MSLTKKSLLLAWVLVCAEVESVNHFDYVWPKNTRTVLFENPLPPLTCHEPDGYELKIDTWYLKSYYRRYTSELKFADAKQICADNGGHLITMKTQLEHDVYMEFVNTYEANTWVGLENPHYVFCRSPDCANKLRWTGDGSIFYQDSLEWFKINVSLNNDVQNAGNLQTECIFWFSNDGKSRYLADPRLGCGEADNPFICQYDCFRED